MESLAARLIAIEHIDAHVPDRERLHAAKAQVLAAIGTKDG